MAGSSTLLEERKSAAECELKRVNPLEHPKWDELALTHPDGTVFHSQGWANVLASTYQYRPDYLVAADQQRLWGMLPLMEVRSWLTGTRGVSLPFTDRCSPLLSQSFGIEKFFDAACAIGRERRWKNIEIRDVPEDFAPASVSFYEHTLNLAASTEALFGECDPAMRRAIRKAEKSGIEVKEANDPEALATYYRFHQMTRQKHGLPPQPLAFFKNIYKFLINSGYGSIFIATSGARPVAGAIFLRFGSHAIYKFGASDPRCQELRPNNLLLWRAALRMKELGAAHLSFGRSSLHQEGLRRFKAGFGARESSVRYARFDFRTSQFQTAQADRSSGLHARVFRHCPRTLSRAIGSFLYRHIG